MSGLVELKLLYEKAIYSVETQAGAVITFKIAQDSAPLNELLAGCGARCWAFITAYNPGSRQLSDRENAARHTLLAAKLQDRQHRFFEGAGADETGDWPAERSLLVLDIELETALAIGREFEQAAIVYGRLGSPPELRMCQSPTPDH